MKSCDWRQSCSSKDSALVWLLLLPISLSGNDNFKSQFRDNVRPLIQTNGHADEYQEALIIDGECWCFFKHTNRSKKNVLNEEEMNILTHTPTYIFQKKVQSQANHLKISPMYLSNIDYYRKHNQDFTLTWFLADYDLYPILSCVSIEAVHGENFLLRFCYFQRSPAAPTQKFIPCMFASDLWISHEVTSHALSCCSNSFGFLMVVLLCYFVYDLTMLLGFKSSLGGKFCHWIQLLRGR